MLDAIRDGGPMAWLVLVMALGTLGVTIGFAARPRRPLWILSLALLGATLGTGLLGTIVGLIQAFGAVASADPSMKAALLARGISVAMNATAFALALVPPWAIGFAIGVIRRRRGA